MGGAQLAAVWKTTQPVADEIQLNLPYNSTLLKVADQDGGGQRLDFWFFVPDVTVQETEMRRLRIAGTGHPLMPAVWSPEDYWDSVITLGGRLVWHVFLAGPR